MPLKIWYYYKVIYMAGSGYASAYYRTFIEFMQEGQRCVKKDCYLEFNGMKIFRRASSENQRRF